jgi:hypothetical protein
VGRLDLPESYGTPRGEIGLLPWAHAEQRLTEAQHYWLCTVRPDGQPHAIPIQGLWHDGALYFGGDPATRWARNLTANPAVTIHLESGSDVVIVEGLAENVSDLSTTLISALAAASGTKYGFTPPPEAYASGVCRVRPRRVLAWNQFLTNATRFTFPAA